MSNENALRAMIATKQLEINKLKPHLICNWGHNQLFKDKILNLPQLGCVNLHPGLLPFGRGSGAIQGEILNGRKIGWTCHFMDKKFQLLPLRIGVGIVVLNKNNKIFVAKRIDNPKDFWQMPQGGVDRNESYLDAAYRELQEETNIKEIELIKEVEEFTTYELPDHLLGIIWKGKFKGQKQKWFIMRFVGNEDEINIKTKKPEFLDWKWIDVNEITKKVVDFKYEVYKKVKKEVEKILN